MSEDGGARRARIGHRTPEQEKRAAERARLRRRRDRGRNTGGEAAGTATALWARAAATRERRGDPRFRRRRVIALAATVLVVALGLCSGAWWALATYGPGVSSVQVAGTRQIPQRDVEDAVGDVTGVPLAAVDTDAVTARVAAIPGVAGVEVARSWPSTVSVSVTERIPAGIVATPDGRRLVDVTGLVYREAPPDVTLPTLQLPRVAPDDPATVAAVTVLHALPEKVLGQVQTLTLGPGGTTFELALTENRRVLWGPWSDTAATEERARALGPLLDQPGTIYDVSSPSLVTVRR